MLPGRVSKLILACVILQREPMVDDHDVDNVDYEHDAEFQDAMTVLNLIANTYF